MRMDHCISHWVVLWNIAAVALSTSDLFASLYAGYFKSELRITLSTLSSVVNGAAAIKMFVFIDPYMSVMTDDVVEGKVSELEFRKFIVWLVGSRQSAVGSRLDGTLLAQDLLVPSDLAIAFIASRFAVNPHPRAVL